jgi:hypothetical protein
MSDQNGAVSAVNPRVRVVEVQTAQLKLSREEYGLVHFAVFHGRVQHVGHLEIVRKIMDQLAPAGEPNPRGPGANGYLSRALFSDSYDFDFDASECAVTEGALPQAVGLLPAGVALPIPELVKRIKSAREALNV